MQCLIKLSKCLLYIIVKCDRLTFICDKEKKKKKHHHTEQNVAKLIWKNMLVITSLMFLELFLFL